MIKKIFVEGIDGVDKSAYIRKIISEHPEMNYKVIHCTKSTNNDYRFFEDVLMSDDNIILDRSYVDQFVYNDNSCRSANRWLNLSSLCVLESIISRMYDEFKMVYVYSDIDKCLENCVKDPDDSWCTKEYLEDLDRRYRYFFGYISSVPVEMCYVEME